MNEITIIEKCYKIYYFRYTSRARAHTRCVMCEGIKGDMVRSEPISEEDVDI